MKLIILQFMTILLFLAGVSSLVYACFLINDVVGYAGLGLALLGVTFVLENNIERS